MKVTLQDIADELDLSATTVSRSLRHDTTINPATRARVNEVARRLGYKGCLRRPRRAVERDTKSSTLGLLVRHISLDHLSYDTNLMKMMAGIMEVLDERRMHLKVHTHRPHATRHMEDDVSLIPPMIREEECQALIAHGDQEERDVAFLSLRLPVVSIARIYRDLPIDAATADNLEGVHRVVTHLVELGHRRLAWVGAHYTATFMEAREAGFIQGCRKYGLELGRYSFLGPEIYRKPDIHDKEGLAAAVNAGITGFVCGNDGIALQVIKVLKAVGLRVPEDVSVTGFDTESRNDAANARQLTSIDPRFFEIGKVAARLALQRMAHPMDEPCIVIVRGKLVAGDTTAPPRG